MRVAPPRRRSTSHETTDGLELAIPARRNVFIMLFLTAWLGGWFFGEISVIRQLLSGDVKDGGLFLVFWLAGWTLGGGFAIYVLLWMAAGKEIVVLRSGTLTIKRDIAGLGPAREYDLAHITNVRVSPDSVDPFNTGMRFWGVSGGLVAFDYGAKTFRFGASIDEAEASTIVNDLKARHAFR